MKKFKKLMCILLAALLLLSTGAFAVSAQEPEQPDMEELHQKFIAYLDEQGWPNASDEISFMLYSNDWIVFFQEMGEPGRVFERIGNHIFFSLSWPVPYDLGIYAEKDGQILTLKEAYDVNAVDIDEIARWCTQPHPSRHYPEVRLPGDSNQDGEIDLADVLNVQKCIAKVWSADDRFLAVFCDYDGNGEINVKDALDMQKKIAKITV